MQYKNIIFDLGNVLVKLNPEGCIGAFKAIGMGELANPNPQSEGMKLMSKLGVGMITTEAFCDASIPSRTRSSMIGFHFDSDGNVRIEAFIKRHQNDLSNDVRQA